MRSWLQRAATVGTGVLAVVFGIFIAGSAGAESPQGLTSPYLGGGVAGGVNDGGVPGSDDDATFGGNFQGRIPIPTLPLSIRGAILWSDTTALMPLLTYDLPIAEAANLYFGGGVSWVEEQGQPTPLGNGDSFVVLMGAEAGLSKNIVIFSDAKWGIDAYTQGSRDALSFQLGAGYRF